MTIKVSKMTTLYSNILDKREGRLVSACQRKFYVRECFIAGIDLRIANEQSFIMYRVNEIRFINTLYYVYCYINTYEYKERHEKGEVKG